MSSHPNVFISYARKDGEAFATKLRNRLETEHPEITLWQDRARMEGGVGWWKQITEALDKVQFLILVMTPGALHSAVSRKEWRHARQQGVCVYPVKGVPDTELDWANMPRWMSKAHFFDLDREWDTFINHLKSPCQAMRAPFMAPDLPEGFVQRPTLFEQLMSQLLERNRENPVTITTTLHGAGGLGKTTLAAALCHHDDIITAYDDGILWITLGQKPQIQAGLAKLYAALTGDHPGFVDEEDAAFHLAQKLEDKSCLIVIDDVWDAAHLQLFLRGAARCTRLITTRNFNIAAETKRVNVDEMTPSEAVQMLTARLPTPLGDLTPFRELAQRLGEWPLLLELANGTLRQLIARGDTLEGSLTYLDEKLEEQGVAAFDQRNPLQRNQAITRTIEVSLDLLTPEERERYLELAIFPEDTGVPLRVVSDVWGLKTMGTKELALRLDSLSLLKFNLQVGTIRLHDVMRAYLATKLANPEKLHGKLVDAWGAPHHLTDIYAWRWLPYQLLGTGRTDDLRKLLLDFDWLQEKLNRTDITALIADYGFDSDVEVRLIRESLLLSAHVLVEDKKQFPGQLLGRLSADISPDIQKLRQKVEHWQAFPWLRPVFPVLIAPGGALCLTLSGHTGKVRAVAVTSDGQRAISASDDCTLKIWNLHDGTEERICAGHADWIRGIAVTSDGQRAVSVSDDHTLRVWDVMTGLEIRQIRIYFDMLTSLALTADGRLAITASHNRTLKVWSLERGTEECTLKGHLGKVNSVAVSPDGQYAVSASDDRTLKIWNLHRGIEERTLRGHTAKVNAVMVSSNGRLVISASADDTLRIWDLESGEEKGAIERSAFLVRGIAITTDAKQIISCSEAHTLKVWDVEGKAQARILRGHTNWVNAVAVTTDGEFAVSASDDRTLRVWNLRRSTDRNILIGHADQVRAVAVTRDGRRAVSSSLDRTLIVWDVERQKKLSTVAKHNRRCLTLTTDDRRILYTSDKPYIHIRDLETGNEQRAFTGHTDKVTAMTVTPDGRLAISASDDRTIKVWDIETGEEEMTIDSCQHWVRALAVTPNGRVLISGSEYGSIKVWNLEHGTEIVTLEHGPKEHSRYAARVNDVVVTPDGQYVISGSDDRTLKVWNLEQGLGVRTLLGHTAEISAVAVSSNGQYVLSASHDYTVRVWDSKKGEIVATFMGDSPMLTCAVGQLGTIVAGDQSGRIHFLRLEGVG
jgi:WD40 repeat protein